MKGVYVIHNQVTGKPYVGSACGDTGIWDRLEEYVTTMHGGNLALRELVDREGREYARANLRFALLEFWSMRTSDEHVLAREVYWKGVLFVAEVRLQRKLMSPSVQQPFIDPHCKPKASASKDQCSATWDMTPGQCDIYGRPIPGRACYGPR